MGPDPDYDWIRIQWIGILDPKHFLRAMYLDYLCNFFEQYCNTHAGVAVPLSWESADYQAYVPRALHMWNMSINEYIYWQDYTDLQYVWCTFLPVRLNVENE